MNRHAMSLVELLAGLAILSVTAGIMTLSSTAVGRKSAKREAEKVCAYISGHIHRANMMNATFWMTVQEDGITVKTGLDDHNAKPEAAIEASTGCKYTAFRRGSSSYTENTPLNLRYNYENDKDSYRLYYLISLNSAVSLSTDKAGKFCIAVTDAASNTCNVIIGR